MKSYNPATIEKKWQKYWETKKLFVTENTVEGKENFYKLVEFPYPSGNLHMGHWYSYAVPDMYARYKRMQGYNVMFPFGFDAFGLPAENAAIKNNVQPKAWTDANVKYMTKQMKSMGTMFDWSRVVNTTDPDYYKWTQWIFLQFYKKGLAYRAKTLVNWCPKDKTVLANEQVVDGKCDRCDSVVEQREREQWMYKITAYADQLLEGLDRVDWPEVTKTAQRNWIGKSEGAEITFQIETSNLPLNPLPKEGGMPGYVTTDAKEYEALYQKALEMRKAPTPAEEILWDVLRANKQDYHFRRQHIIDHFIVDFLCLSKNLVIEVDGDIHDYQAEKDEERTARLQSLGFTVLRFQNKEILENLNAATSKINATLKMLPDLTPSPWERDGERFKSVEIFTTRPDTLFGATYLVLAPEHPLIEKFTAQTTNAKEVEEYITRVKNKSALQRQESKEKTGVELKGVFATNPANQEKISVWVADYVLGSYGTGAIMAVPAHDQRDFEFAKKYGLPIREVILQEFGEKRADSMRLDSIRAIITREKDKKIVIVYNRISKKYDLPGGGLLENENENLGLRREVTEETGYINFEVKEYLGQNRVNFFSLGRNSYRTKNQKAYHVVLLDEQSVQIHRDDFEDMELHWLDPEEAIHKLNLDENTAYESEFVKRFINPKLQCYTGEGKLVNSGRFDDMESEQAKQEIIKSLNQESRVNCVIVHGCPGDKESMMDLSRRTYNKHWMPWIRTQLDTMGVPAEIVLMPEPWAPSYEQWKKEFEKQTITEDTILIGHSCGCAFLTHWLGETKKKIKALILVAPWKIVSNKHQETTKRKEIFSTFYGFELDPGIKDRVRKIVYFTSDTEREDGKKSLKLYHDVLGGTIISLPNHGHYITEDMESDAFPELIDQIGLYIRAHQKNTYRLRDWVLSRQRYWGTPIPMIACDECGYQPVPEEDLPVKLPKLDNYLPADDGSSPLARAEKWVKTRCPNCGKPATRETDTMDTFVDSSWYFLRYPSVRSATAGQVPWDPELTKLWLPVDVYTGGAEHNTMHLLYSRFFTKALHDLGLVDFDEPFTMRRNHGIVLGPDGQKMSKSKGNVIDPDKEVAEYGADTVRMFLAFLGPYDTFNGPWDPKGITGIHRFLNRVWKLAHEEKKAEEKSQRLHQAIKKVGDDIEKLHFNTAISELMKLLNEREVVDEAFLRLLAPFAPHITEELWSKNHTTSIHLEPWPVFDPALIKEDMAMIAIQVNGKTRAVIQLPTESDEQAVRAAAEADERVTRHLSGPIKKVIFVKGKLCNLVL